MKERIEEVLNKDVRPALQRDGGNIELVDVIDGVVKVRLRGACAGCPMSQLTMTNFVEGALKGKIPEIKKVEAVL
jgi:Fe-S cluster biogenesis protein NfuA